MFKITKALVEHLKTIGLPEDADENATREFAITKMVSGDLTAEKLRELTSEPSPLKGQLAEMVKSEVSAAFTPVLDEIKSLFGGQPPTNVGGDGANSMPPQNKAGGDAGGQNPPASNPEKAMVLGADAGGSQGGDDRYVRVKSVIERYDDTRTAATWDKSGNEFLRKGFAGQSVTAHVEGAGPLDMPTKRSLAISGAYFKYLINKQCNEERRAVPWQFKMTEHDCQLVEYALRECQFTGPVGYGGSPAKSISDVGRDTDQAQHWCDYAEMPEQYREKALSHLPDWYRTKTILDDATSGGLEAVPIEFDAAVILTPLLSGELFPLVNITPVTRRRIEATAIGNPTIGWGTAEGTSVSLFDTTSYISAFDTTIYPVTGALDYGRDFASDSPLAIGMIIQQRYGEVFKQEMDNVIANGNGTNRPEGLFVASGVSTLNSAGGAGTAPQVGDYEGLQFGIGKAFLQEAGIPPNSRAVFLGTQTSYQRARSIPVDSSNDARRIFGQGNQMNYRLMDFRYAINSSAGNAKIGYFCLNRYRLYRRQGLEVRIVNDDRESVLKNTELIAVRARFGGGLEHSSAGVKIEDAQA